MREAHDPGFLELSDEELREAALGNWVQLNKVLRRASPRLVHRLLGLELRNGRRDQIVTRLYGRLAKLRAAGERRALLRACAAEDSSSTTPDSQFLMLCLDPGQLP